MLKQLWARLFGKRGPSYMDIELGHAEVSVIVFTNGEAKTYKSRDPVAMAIARHVLEVPRENLVITRKPFTWNDLNERLDGKVFGYNVYTTPLADSSWLDSIKLKVRELRERAIMDPPPEGWYTPDDQPTYKQFFNTQMGSPWLAPRKLKEDVVPPS